MSRFGAKMKQRCGDLGPFHRGPCSVDRSRNQVGWIAKCDCGFTDYWSGPFSVPLDNVRQKFTQKGWQVLANRCICSACVEKAKPKPRAESAPSITPKLEPVSMAVTKPEAVPEGVRAIEKKTERKVFALLETYFDEVDGGGGRYQEGWSDENVAEEAECQVWWVRRIREDAYGKLVAAPEVLAVRADIEGLRKEIGQSLTAVADRLAAIESKANGDLSNLDKRLAKIETKHG